MQNVYAMDEMEKRKLRFLYHQSGIERRYSVIPDYSLNAGEWQFYTASENLEPFPDLELRMRWYNKTAAPLSINAIQKCIDHGSNEFADRYFQNFHQFYGLLCGDPRNETR